MKVTAGPAFFEQLAELFVELLSHVARSLEVGRAEGLRFAIGEKARRVVRNGGGNQALQAVNRFFMRRARVVGRKVQHREAGLGRCPAQGLENLLLVAKVVVDKRLGHAQRLHDLLYGRAGIAIAVEQRFGGLENALALLVRARRGKALPAARSHGWWRRF